MKTLRQLLAEKTGPLAVVAPQDTVFHALEVMATHNVGAVLVMDGENLVGIFSERDYARRLALHGRDSKSTPVRETMSERVAFVTPDNTLDECMALMSDKRFRHLPVVSEGHLVGIVSIGDLVKEIIARQQITIAELERYISG